MPTEARLKFLVQQMYGYGPMPDPKEWLPHSCHSLVAEPASPQPSEDCVARDGGTVIMEANSASENDGMVLNTTMACDPVTDPATPSSQTSESHGQENQEMKAHISH